MMKYVMMVLLLVSFNLQAKKLFKENKAYFQALKTVQVFSDALIMDDFGNNIQGLDVEHNFLVNELMFKKIRYYLADTLEAKFISAHSSVGMHQAGHVYAINTYDKNQQIFLPVVAEQSAGNYPQAVIDRVFEDMRVRSNKSQRNKRYQERFLNHQFDDVASLNLAEDEAALFFLIEGAKVPDKNRGSKTAMSLLLTLGTAFTVELSVYNTYLVIVDHQGQVRWAAVAGKPGDILEDDDQTSTIWASFKRFPVRVKNRSVR